MALPRLRRYSIERLLRGVQMQCSLSLSLFFVPSLLFHFPLPVNHLTSVSSWSSSSSSSFSTFSFLTSAILFPRTLLSSSFLYLSFCVSCYSFPVISLLLPFFLLLIPLALSRNPTTSSLHDRRRVETLPVPPYLDLLCASTSRRLSSHRVKVGRGEDGGLSVTSLYQRRSVSLLLRSEVV